MTHYGELVHIISITLPQDHESLHPSRQVNSIVALVSRCTLKDDPQLTGLDFHSFSKKRKSFDVIDITSVQCLVGRVKSRNSWAIIDRGRKLAQAICQEQGNGEQELA